MTVLYFGRHKGKALPEIPSGYLVWALRTVKFSSGLRAAVAAELESRGVAAPAPATNPNACWHGPCGRCGAALTYRWHEFRNGVRQIRAACSRCYALHGLAPLVEPYISEANRNASPTAILDALALAEDEGVRLVSDGRSVWPSPWERASRRLKDLVRERSNLLARMIGDNSREVRGR